MTDDEIVDVLAEVGAGWLMDEDDEGCQTKAIRHIVSSAIAAEREACAKVCEVTQLLLEDHKYPSKDERTLIAITEAGCRGAFAEAIRNRSA